nr:hypothetical protein [Tanacetum cinerariifolium]
MAALKYKEEHNKVGYLLKPTSSDDYHQIIDFLSVSHIRYALIASIIISDSLIKQFWSTATLKASELGLPAILATIDNTHYTITGDLVQSRFQLAEDGGVTDLPILEIYSGMGALGYVTEGIETRVNKQYKVMVFSSKLFANMRHNFAGNPMPLLPTMLLQVAAEDAHMGADFHTSPVRSSHAPPVDHPSGGVEDPITLTALSSIVSTLVEKVHSLEAEMHDHKKIFKNVMGKLVKKSQELKNVLYHKLYDILKQHQHEVNEIQAEKLARVANPLSLVAEQQPVYHP